MPSAAHQEEKKKEWKKKTELQDKMDIAKHDDQPHEL
jgi:hypothetical protein